MSVQTVKKNDYLYIADTEKITSKSKQSPIVSNSYIINFNSNQYINIILTVMALLIFQQ